MAAQKATTAGSSTPTGSSDRAEIASCEVPASQRIATMVYQVQIALPMMISSSPPRKPARLPPLPRSAIRPPSTARPVPTSRPRASDRCWTVRAIRIAISGLAVVRIATELPSEKWIASDVISDEAVMAMPP